MQELSKNFFKNFLAARNFLKKFPFWHRFFSFFFNSRCLFTFFYISIIYCVVSLKVQRRNREGFFVIYPQKRKKFVQNWICFFHKISPLILSIFHQYSLLCTIEIPLSKFIDKTQNFLPYGDFIHFF